MELFVNPADISAHRLKADAELIGNFFIHEPLTQQIQDFLFAGGKFFRRFGRGSGRAGFYSDERYFRPLQRGKILSGVGQAAAVPQGAEESPGSRERDAG